MTLRRGVRMAMRPGGRVWAIVAVSIVALVAIIAMVRSYRQVPLAASKTTTATVTRGLVTVEASAAGTIVAAQTRGLSFSMSGTVTEVDAKPGDRVSPGQVLARIDDSTAQAALSAAQDQLNTANDSLSAAEQTPTPAVPAQPTGQSCPTGTAPAPRVTKTASASETTGGSGQGGTGATPTASSTASARPTLTATAGSGTGGRTGSCQGGSGGNTGTSGAANGAGAARGAGAVFSAQQQVNNAQLALAQAQRQLDGTTITAPVAGRVLSVAGVVGSTESPGATPFIALSTADDVQVHAQFSQLDATRLAIGQDASITLPDRAGASFKGRVAEIDPAGTASGRLVVFGALIAFDQPPTDLLYGQTADVSVTVASASDVLYLPSSAVTLTGPGGAGTGPGAGTGLAAASDVQPDATGGGDGTVLVRTGDRYQPRQVAVGLRGDRYTEITSGLAEGDLVEVPGGN